MWFFAFLCLAALTLALGRLRAAGLPAVLLYTLWNPVGHALVYGLLTLVSLRAFGARTRPLRALATSLFLAALAGLDEWTQPAFGRVCDLGDWLADLGGVALALAAVGLLVLARLRASES